VRSIRRYLYLVAKTVAVRTGPLLTSAFHVDRTKFESPVQLRRNIAGVALTAKSVTNWSKSTSKEKHGNKQNREDSDLLLSFCTAYTVWPGNLMLAIANPDSGLRLSATRTDGGQLEPS
jgi:hypothetical protein